MKSLLIVKLYNKRARLISVHERYREEAFVSLNAMPFIEEAKVYPNTKTRIVAWLSHLTEAEDLDYMEKTLRLIVEQDEEREVHEALRRLNSE